MGVVLELLHGVVVPVATTPLLPGRGKCVRLPVLDRLALDASGTTSASSIAVRLVDSERDGRLVCDCGGAE